MIIVESAGSGSALWSSLRSSSAATRPSPSWTGLTSEIVPTREPPIRTSLPLTSAFAFGTRALMS